MKTFSGDVCRVRLSGRRDAADVLHIPSDKVGMHRLQRIREAYRKSVPLIEAIAFHSLQLQLERVIKAASIEKDAWLLQPVEAYERYDFGNFLKRAAASGERDIGIALLKHDAFSLRHGLDHSKLGESAVFGLPFDKETWDDAMHLATPCERGIRDDAHESDASAAVDKGISAGSDPCPQGPGTGCVRRIVAEMCTAIDCDIHAFL